MTIEAPVSKYKKTNFKIYIAVCIVLAVVFAYDGYLSRYEWSLRRSFYEEHVEEGKPDDTMIFNQKAPIFLVAIAALLAARFWTAKDKKLLANENELIISDKERIPYDSIQKIDRTRFKSKGSFIVTYRNNDGREVNRKFSDRAYDNLAVVLEHLVAKIS